MIRKTCALGAVMAVGALSACSVLQSDKVDYRSSTKAPELAVPPDLTQLSRESRYTVIDGAISASGVKSGQGVTAKLPVGALAIGDVRIERAGDQRFLVVKRPSDKLWDLMRNFWRDNGFQLAMDESSLGIMETEWNENRAKIPQDVIRASIGKLFDFAYSSPERDKYRTRLETNAAGETEIYISHRGVAEVYTRERSGDTVWQMRPVDPELEAEFLRRLMVRLGTTEQQAETTMAASSKNVGQRVANVSEANGQPIVVISEEFDRAWRRVGLALDRSGFTIEDRDRKQGIYYVRYVAVDPNNTEPGFFEKLFSSNANKNGEATKYQIAVRSGEGSSTTVSVLDERGKADKSEAAQQIVKRIAEDIK